jgi:hypothetical protein
VCVNLPRSTRLVGTALSSEVYSLTLLTNHGERRPPDQGPPLTDRPIYYTQSTLLLVFTLYCKLTEHTNTINSAWLRRQTIQHPTPSFNSHSADDRLTPTDTPIYIPRTAKHLPSLSPMHATKLSTIMTSFVIICHNNSCVAPQNTTHIKHLQLGSSSFDLHAPINQQLLK